MEYRIKKVGSSFEVWEGHITYSCFVPEEMVYEGSLADALAWIEVKKQNLFM